MLSLKQIARTRWAQKTVGVVAAEYLRLVYWTSRLVTEPADIYERVAPDLPVIIAMWHGQHFMAPFIKRPHLPGKTLISRHRDGEINAIAAEWLGVETIRGSGDHGNGFHRKGGVGAYRQMLDALGEGYSVALTADVPKVARVAGPGIVRLGARFRTADLSGGARLQPPRRIRQLGSLGDESAVQPAGRRGRRADPRPRDHRRTVLEAARRDGRSVAERRHRARLRHRRRTRIISWPQPSDCR